MLYYERVVLSSFDLLCVKKHYTRRWVRPFRVSPNYLVFNSLAFVGAVAERTPMSPPVAPVGVAEFIRYFALPKHRQKLLVGMHRIPVLRILRFQIASFFFEFGLVYLATRVAFLENIERTLFTPAIVDAAHPHHQRDDAGNRQRLPQHHPQCTPAHGASCVKIMHINSLYR